MRSVLAQLLVVTIVLAACGKPGPEQIAKSLSREAQGAMWRSDTEMGPSGFLNRGDSISLPDAWTLEFHYSECTNNLVPFPSVAKCDANQDGYAWKPAVARVPLQRLDEKSLQVLWTTLEKEKVRALSMKCDFDPLCGLDGEALPEFWSDEEGIYLLCRSAGSCSSMKRNIVRLVQSARSPDIAKQVRDQTRKQLRSAVPVKDIESARARLALASTLVSAGDSVAPNYVAAAGGFTLHDENELGVLFYFCENADGDRTKAVEACRKADPAPRRKAIWFRPDDLLSVEFRSQSDADGTFVAVCPIGEPNCFTLGQIVGQDAKAPSVFKINCASKEDCDAIVKGVGDVRAFLTASAAAPPNKMPLTSKGDFRLDDKGIDWLLDFPGLKDSPAEPPPGAPRSTPDAQPSSIFASRAISDALSRVNSAIADGVRTKDRTVYLTPELKPEGSHQLRVHSVTCRSSNVVSDAFIAACQAGEGLTSSEWGIIEPSAVDPASISLYRAKAAGEAGLAVMFRCKLGVNCVMKEDHSRYYPGSALYCADDTACNRLVTDLASLLDLRAQQNSASP